VYKILIQIVLLGIFGNIIHVHAWITGFKAGNARGYLEGLDEVNQNSEENLTRNTRERN
jgi:hypothetical protein